MIESPLQIKEDSCRLCKKLLLQTVIRTGHAAYNKLIGCCLEQICRMVLRYIEQGGVMILNIVIYVVPIHFFSV
jgi:hypothetical protein